MAGGLKLNIQELKNSLFKVSSTQHLRVGAAAPIDWNAQGKVAPIVYQGQCGCCWAFSTVAVSESYIAIKNTTSPPILSQQYILECTNEEYTCNGGNMDLGMDLAIRTGIPS